MNALIYIMDPMCSWCWAFAPELQAIRCRFAKLPVSFIMGGLAPDSTDPMDKGLAQQIQATWQQIEARTGTVFNHDFWTLNSPRRATYDACRAVIAATRIRPDAQEAMIDAIQRGYYLQAKNPSDPKVLTALAQQIGLEAELFDQYMGDEMTQGMLQQHLAIKGSLGVQGFPTLLLQKGEKLHWLSTGYRQADGIIAQLEKLTGEH
ncbi:DsbA family protein [Marinobacterium sedimentorum]|uniref:DsbA family protein n=1 Tax=Marinobacterium sedimentorum TaxID=2927804 RepID=UPI0020C738A6|nr:DsbA family protein [Marinobacterium sedimentorum]MCP8690289.1 DsbA family protein [Marinobacterium sedimentorum]